MELLLTEDDVDELGVARTAHLHQDTTAGVADVGAVLEDVMEELPPARLSHLLVAPLEGVVVCRCYFDSSKCRLRNRDANEKKHGSDDGVLGHVWLRDLFFYLFFTFVLYLGCYLEDMIGRRYRCSFIGLLGRGYIRVFINVLKSSFN